MGSRVTAGTRYEEQPMGSSYDVEPNTHIEGVAKKLQEDGNIKPPAWATYVKTGAHKERPPVRADWWYVRAAAVLRAVNRLGPIGVSKLRTKYGGKKNRGHMPDGTKRGSGSIIRKILQQLEKAKLIAPVPKGIHKGRIIAPKGRSLLDKEAAVLHKARPQPKAVPKPEPPTPKAISKHAPVETPSPE